VHTYPFADLALARRLERAEATSNARFVELRVHQAVGALQDVRLKA